MNAIHRLKCWLGFHAPWPEDKPLRVSINGYRRCPLCMRENKRAGRVVWGYVHGRPRAQRAVT